MNRQSFAVSHLSCKGSLGSIADKFGLAAAYLGLVAAYFWLAASKCELSVAIPFLAF